MKERKYRNPPIVEVVCEFRFAETSEWDSAIPGLIYAELQDTFPLRRPLKQLDFAMQFQPGDDTIQHQWNVDEGIRFLRTDERAFVQLLPHQISIHHLAPYPHWEGFRPLLEKTWQAYITVLSDANIRRIGLRYINRILLPEVDPMLSDYFTVYPTVGSMPTDQYAAFALQLLFPFCRDRDTLHLRFASEEMDGADNFAAILDFDYSLTDSTIATNTIPLDWVDVAHENIRQSFEGCITDRLRAHLDEEK